MSKSFLAPFLLFLAFSNTQALSPYKRVLSQNETGNGGGTDASPAVFVTPLLPDNFNEAQAMAKMNGLPHQYDMYGGFFTIDDDTDSNTYFVFSKALNGNNDAPILLWLQGGPGASSMFGLFTEIGPFNIDQAMKIDPRNMNWNQDHHMLFFDNPLGTGFIFCRHRTTLWKYLY